MGSERTLLIGSRIKALYETLSPSDKMISDYILANEETLQGLTTTSLAKNTGTSPATVVRFCRRLGFSGFSELKFSLLKEQLAPGEELTKVLPGDSVGAIRQKVIAFNQRAVEALSLTMEDAALDAAARLIAGASRFVIFSDGGSSASALCAYDVFSKLAIRCEYITDPFFQAMAVRQMGEKGVLLVVCHSGRSESVITGLRFAKECGVSTVGIIGSPHTPCAKHLDVQITTNFYAEEILSDLAVARVGEICAISVLHSIIASRYTPEQIQQSKRQIAALESKRVDWHSNS